MRLFKWILAVVALLVLRAPASAGIDEAMRARLQRAVDSVQVAEKIQGVSAAVMLGEDLWTGVAGGSYAGNPMRPDMVLGIGSNSKTCMSVTLLRLQEQGLLNLDSPIGTWVPRHPNIDSTITVRQLLNHTSGVGDFSALKSYRDACLAEPTRTWKLNELLDLVPERQFAPGTSNGYCNTNYLLAGIVAQEATGLSLYQLFRRELFNPLSMDSTRLFPDEQIIGELAHRWMGGRDASNGSMNAEWSGAWAAGAVISTAAEMAQFYEALFSGRVLNAESMTQLTSFVGANDYGLGISRKMIGGTTVIGHTGEIRGYSSVMFRVPSIQASIVVLTNSIPSNPLGVAAAIVRVLRGGTTSVLENTPDDPSYLYPVGVFGIDGTYSCQATSFQDLQQLRQGVYILIRNGSCRVVSIAEDGAVSIAN
ncbi:MAG: serine hydrolase domain-containing protein [Ignavibacteria bacterium]|jgi:D-alanyl-D-alanine carboxypeptidase